MRFEAIINAINEGVTALNVLSVYRSDIIQTLVTQFSVVVDQTLQFTLLN